MNLRHELIFEELRELRLAVANRRRITSHFRLDRYKPLFFNDDIITPSGMQREALQFCGDEISKRLEMATVAARSNAAFDPKRDQWSGYDNPLKKRITISGGRRISFTGDTRPPLLLDRNVRGSTSSLGSRPLNVVLSSLPPPSINTGTKGWRPSVRSSICTENLEGATSGILGLQG